MAEHMEENFVVTLFFHVDHKPFINKAVKWSKMGTQCRVV